MTRGPMMMAETRWSLGGDTPADSHDAESMSTAPPISSYRAMYQHSVPTTTTGPAGEGAGGTNSTPDQAMATPMPSVMSGVPSTMSMVPEAYGFLPSDWTPRDHHHHYPIDLARVQLKPNSQNSVSDMSKTRSDSDLYGRSVNERLDKYMVIRQRTFHGLARSKNELRQLPLTDPRETMSEGSTPTWLHRSKTDLYIEKWRSKTKRQDRNRSKSGSSSLDLEGITLGSLYESLPRSRSDLTHSSPPRTLRKEVKFQLKPSPGALASNGSETRFPPLQTKSSRKSPVEESNRRVTNHRKLSSNSEVAIASLSTPSPAKDPSFGRKTSTTKILVLPTDDNGYDEVVQQANDVGPDVGLEQGGNRDTVIDSMPSPKITNDLDDDEPAGTSPRPKRKGRLRKQPNVAIPLKLWEPSFECVVVSSQKVLQPRHLVRAWQKPGPLK